MSRPRKNNRIAFEQQVLRTLRGIEPRPRRLLVGCSGGIDSMVLLEVLWRLRNVLDLELIVAHVHHGPGRGVRYRARAWKFVRDYSQRRNLRFVSNSTDGKPTFARELKSEASLRELRWEFLRKSQQELDCEAVAVAHHYQDLLETRIMRLVRGTGPLGFTSLRIFSDGILRPLLMAEKIAIVAYASLAGVEFVNDPSNRRTDSFRNWTRQWLAVLEKRHPGGMRNLVRSLGGLAQLLEVVKETDSAFMTDSGIDRRVYLASSREQRKASLAQYCLKLGLKNYTSGHIEELIKRLDDRQKRFTFALLHCVWNVSTERIEASRV